MITIPIDVRGADRVAAGVRKAMDAHLNAFHAALYMHGGRVATLAQRKSPVATGTNRRSAYVTHPSHSANTYFELLVGFWAYYSEIIHENRRGVRFRVGEDHFLTKAAVELAAGASSWIAGKTAAFVASGTTIDRVKLPHPTGPLIGPQVQPSRRIQQRGRSSVRRRRAAKS